MSDSHHLMVAENSSRLIPPNASVCTTVAYRAWSSPTQARTAEGFTAVQRRCTSAAVSETVPSQMGEQHHLSQSSCVGVGGLAIHSTLRHAKFDTTAAYIRSADRFGTDAAGKVGL